MAWFGFEGAGVDEDGDGYRHVATGDEVVEDDGDSPASFGVFVAFAVLKNHERGGITFFVLGWYVDGPIAGGVSKDV